jgi:nicotinamidase-related amidase
MTINQKRQPGDIRPTEALNALGSARVDVDCIAADEGRTAADARGEKNGSLASVEAALPYPFAFKPEQTALIVIDMQNDFCMPGGFGELLGNDITPVRDIVPTVAALLETARQAGLLVIHTREGHLPDLSDCPPAKLERSRRQGAGIGDEGPLGRILVRGERGHAIIDELTPVTGEHIIDKPGKGAFYNTELESLLQERDIRFLLLCGVTTHVCVHTTLREANDRGYRCLVLEDGTAAFDPADQEAALRMVRQQGGIFGWTSTVSELRKAL